MIRNSTALNWADYGALRHSTQLFWVDGLITTSDSCACKAQTVITSVAQMAANSAGQIVATVATLAVIPKISSRRPKLGQYRPGQARRTVIEKSGSRSTTATWARASWSGSQAAYDEERYGGGDSCQVIRYPALCAAC